MDFKTWILQFKNIDTSIGTFAKEVARDPNFPKTKDCDEILKHFTTRHSAHPGFITRFKYIFEFYEKDISH